MPWNGCKFYGDPETPAELWAKAQEGDESDNADEESNCPKLKVVAHVGGEGVIVDPVYASSGCPPPQIGERHSYPCYVVVPAWDGGLCYLDENDPEEFASILNAGSITFDVIGKVAGLTGYAIKTTALNDYQKDLKGAERKMEVASSRYAEHLEVVNATGERIINAGGNIDSLAGQLEGIKSNITFFWIQISTALSDLASLSTALSKANSLLDKAKADKARADNRNNFAKGEAGATAQKNARTKANADIASASKQIVSVEDSIKKKTKELKTASDDYNKEGEKGKAVSTQILAQQAQILNLKSVYDSQLGALKGDLDLRNGAVDDMQNAQDTLAGKLAPATALAEASVGSSGVSQTLKYLASAEYFKATGAGINTGIDVSSYHIPGALGLNPYLALLKTASSAGFDTLQNGGDFKQFAENLGEALIGVKSSQQIFNAVEGALLIMPQDPYTAWQIIAVQTHSGVGVLGKIATTVSPFLGAVPVTAFIPALIPIAQSVASGAVSTAVESGHIFATRGISAEIGSGKVGGASSVIFGAVASVAYGPMTELENMLSKYFGDGAQKDPNTALAIQRMARTGMDQVRRIMPQFRVNVDMRKVGHDSDPDFIGDIIQ